MRYCPGPSLSCGFHYVDHDHLHCSRRRCGCSGFVVLPPQPEQPAELEIVAHDVAYDLRAEDGVIVAVAAADVSRQAQDRIDADGRTRVVAVRAA